MCCMLELLQKFGIEEVLNYSFGSGFLGLFNRNDSSILCRCKSCVCNVCAHIFLIVAYFIELKLADGAAAALQLYLQL